MKETDLKPGTLIKAIEEFYYIVDDDPQTYKWTAVNDIYMIVKIELLSNGIKLFLLNPKSQSVVCSPFTGGTADMYFKVLPALKRTSQRKRPHSK